MPMFFTAEAAAGLEKFKKRYENLETLIQGYENEGSVSDNHYRAAIELEERFASENAQNLEVGEDDERHYAHQDMGLPEQQGRGSAGQAQ